MPKILTLARLLGYERLKKQSSPTSNSTVKRLARLVALSQLTKDVFGGSFTLNIRIAFGNDGDHASYVAVFMPKTGKMVN